MIQVKYNAVLQMRDSEKQETFLALHRVKQPGPYTLLRRHCLADGEMFGKQKRMWNEFALDPPPVSSANMYLNLP